MELQRLRPMFAASLPSAIIGEDWLRRSIEGWAGALPQAEVMGVVGFAALLANVAVAVTLRGHRGGDANRRSAWICSRNDAVGNAVVLLAAAGVFGAGTG